MSRQPKRYEFESYTGGYFTDHEMNEREDGEYVKHEDYAQLERERVEVATENIRLRCALREMIDHCEKCGVVSTPAFENAKLAAVSNG